MDFDNFIQKPGLVVVFTGEGKGKTSAALGLMCRALGAGWSVAFLQFIKHWEVNEHKFINQKYIFIRVEKVFIKLSD